jgi:predicted nuclease of restriction endonuclease-like (RecB) superfamily
LPDKQHNFQHALPEHLAEQADQAMKDVYMLDMLGVAEPILEAQLEARMVEKIKEVLLELGYGFAFISNQYRIVANEKEYFIDLLFYRRLHALVTIELKVGHFKPEYAGKMNFYLNLLDDFVREEDENLSIGIILCSE